MLPPLGVTRASGALVLSALLLACENGQPPRNAGGPSSGAPPACGDLGVSGERCEELLALALPETLPPSQGNAYADEDAAAELGFLSFYDPRFSGIPDVRCATCHLPEKSFHDAKPVSEVVPGQPVARNSPTILTAAWMGPFFFWDGRADSLWSQPLFAFEAPDEMGSSRLAVAHALHANPMYASRYEAIFGALPPLDDTDRFPPSGAPGDPAFDQMSPEDQDAINRVFANLGKALEAYMRKVAIGPGALERYLAGDLGALGDAARSGLGQLLESGCTTCHSGHALSDGGFHPATDPGRDEGRAAGLPVLLSNPFNSRGAYWDEGVGTPPELPEAAGPEDVGALRTPSLRLLSLTGPYGHAGRYATLPEFLQAHDPSLSDAQINDLAVLLLSLDGAYPERPWSDWPAR